MCSDVVYFRFACMITCVGQKLDIGVDVGDSMIPYVTRGQTDRLHFVT